MIRWQFDNSKIWFIVGGVGVAVVSVFISLIPSRTRIQTPAPDKIAYSYEMPRMETNEMPFDISGRRVVRQYPAGEQPQAAVPFVKQEVAPIAKTNGTAGKAFPKIKKETAKEKAAREAKERAKKVAEARKKNHKVQVISASDRFRMRAETERPKIQTPPPQQYAPYVVQGPQTPVVDDPLPDKPDDDVIDPSTWQSMLQAQPNAANISKFMKARTEGKIADGAFYRIVTVLLQDRAPDRRKAALQILDTDTAPKTYEFIVLGALSLGPDIQAELRTLQAKYTTPSKIFLLGRVLASTANKTVLLAALLQLNQAASTAGPLPAPGQPAGQNTGIHAQLNSMLGVLRKVAQNPDANVSGQAKALLSTLQKA